MGDKQSESEKLVVKLENPDHIACLFPACDFHWVIFTAFKERKHQTPHTQTPTPQCFPWCFSDELHAGFNHKSIKHSDSFSHFIARETGLQRFPMADICLRWSWE